MAVYIDDMYKTPIGQYGRMKMSHMIADTRAELIEMCRKIGVNTKWIQNYDTPREHFDVCMSKRSKAIHLGAIQITYRDLAEKTRTRTYEGKTQIY